MDGSMFSYLDPYSRRNNEANMGQCVQINETVFSLVAGRRFDSRNNVFPFTEDQRKYIDIFTETCEMSCYCKNIDRELF